MSANWNRRSTAAPSRAGWEANGIPKEERFCVRCGQKVTLKEKGGLDMRGFPVKYVAHMRDCEKP